MFFSRISLREKPLHTSPWTGFISDPVVRQYGTKMVEWTIPGEAVIVGRAKDGKAAKKLVDSLMAKSLMLFLLARANHR